MWWGVAFDLPPAHISLSSVLLFSKRVDPELIISEGCGGWPGDALLCGDGTRARESCTKVVTVPSVEMGCALNTCQ